MAYVIFKEDMTCDNNVLFKAGEKYDILGETEDRYYISYMWPNKNVCSRFPKNFDGMTVFDGNVI
jgi:hypothetical protein